jgi:hypothetical protein
MRDEIPAPLPWAACAILSVGQREHPAIARAICNQRQVYADSFALLAAPPAGVRVQVIAPPPDFPVSRFTRDRELVLRGYEIGYDTLIKS